MDIIQFDDCVGCVNRRMGALEGRTAELIEAMMKVCAWARQVHEGPGQGGGLGVLFGGLAGVFEAWRGAARALCPSRGIPRP
jgi:hypothetical protein